MAQYCRYCSELVVGDVAWCNAKEKQIPEHLAKTTNYCPLYDLNPIDAFGENEKGYQPRHKRENEQQCTGQMNIYDFCPAAGMKEGDKDGGSRKKSVLYEPGGDLPGIQRGKE